VEIKLKIEKEIGNLLDSNREFRAKELLVKFPKHKPLVAYTIKSLLGALRFLRLGVRGAHIMCRTPIRIALPCPTRLSVGEGI